MPRGGDPERIEGLHHRDLLGHEGGAGEGKGRRVAESRKRKIDRSIDRSIERERANDENVYIDI